MKKDHAHKYLRYPWGQGFMWRCIKEGCSHFAIEKFIIGRKAECHACGSTFYMSVKTLQKKPQCGCLNKGRQVEKVVPRSAVDELMEKLRVPVPVKEEGEI